MEKTALETRLTDIANLIKRKQFIVSEQKARDLLKILKSNDPGDYDGYIRAVLLLADSLTKNIKNLKALEELEKVYEQFPFEKRLLAEIAELALKLKRLPRAEASLKSMVNISPDDMALKIKLVYFYIEKDDNINAIMELNNIIGLEIYDLNIHKLYASLLEKEGMYVELLKEIKFLQKLEPESLKFLLDEARTMLKLNQQTESFDLINNLLNYKFSEEQIDHEFVACLSGFADLYTAQGYKHLLAEFFIKTLSAFHQKLPNDIKLKLEKFAVEMKWNLIFNFLAKNQIVVKYDNAKEDELIENISLLLQNKQYLENQKVSLREYLKKVELKKLVSRHLHPFIDSLVEVERQIA